MLHNNPPYYVRIPHTILESPILYKNPPSYIRIPMKNSFPGESKPYSSEFEPCSSESESCPSESEPCPSESESGRDHYMRIPHTI